MMHVKLKGKRLSIGGIFPLEQRRQLFARLKSEFYAAHDRRAPHARFAKKHPKLAISAEV
jgi:hypothetical protein